MFLEKGWNDNLTIDGVCLWSQFRVFDPEVRHSRKSVVRVDDSLDIFSGRIMRSSGTSAGLRAAYNCIRFLKTGQLRVRDSYSPPSPQTWEPYNAFFEKKSKSILKPALSTTIPVLTNVAAFDQVIFLSAGE
jgi:hypothetical protein